MEEGMVVLVTVNNLHGLVCIPRKKVYIMRTPSLIYILHNDHYTSYATHSYSVTYICFVFSLRFPVWSVVPSILVSCHINLFMILQNTFA